MIAQLSGQVVRTEANSVVLDVGGVGYRVFVPLTVLSALPPPGGKAVLVTTLVVREDDMTLYGFRTLDEQAAFGLLTSVTGVGPRVALAMMSSYEVPDLARAISSNDTKALTRIPGVGPKLAQRVILELGERMAELVFAQRVGDVGGDPDAGAVDGLDDIIEALVNLGYSRPDSRRAAERAVAAAPDRSNTPGLIREALNILSGPRR